MVATTGSIYDKITILPPLSFFTPTLYKTNAMAVGKSPKINEQTVWPWLCIRHGKTNE